MIVKYRATIAVILMIALLTTGCASASPTATMAPNTQVPVTSSSPVPTATSAAQPTAAAMGDPTAVPTESVPATGSNPAQGLTWVIVPKQSEARYRVREQLANRDLPNDAIGVTKEISGMVVVGADGAIDTASSKITVNMASLATDQSRRDNFVRGNVLETDQYPEAVFVPTAVSGLTLPLPTSGQVTFQVTGDLTIRNVTKPVTWNVTGSIDGGQATGTATTSFTFAEFSINQPRVPVVLSVDDNIRLEVDVTLQQQ